MSGPVEPWTKAHGLTGAEARAAALFAKVTAPSEVSAAVQTRHLAVLRGEVKAPFRLRVSTPAAVAVFLGASMALAATRTDVREWVKEQLQWVGVLAPAQKRSPPPVVLAPAPVAAAEEAVTLEDIAVRVDAGPVELAAPAPAPRAVPLHPASKPAAPPATRAALPVVDAPAAAAVPAVGGAPPTAETPPIPETLPPGTKPPRRGLLSGGDLPDVSAMPAPERIEALMERGDLDEAQDGLDQQAGDHSDTMNLLRGEVLRARDRCREANVYFTSVIETPHLPDALYERALYGRAVCFAQLGNGPASHADIDRYVGKFPNGRFKETDKKLHSH